MAKAKVDLSAGRTFRTEEDPLAEPVVTDGGTVGITLHASPAVRKQLNELAYTRRTSAQQLLCEALNMLFAVHHLDEIAAVIPRQAKQKRSKRGRFGRGEGAAV